MTCSGMYQAPIVRSPIPGQRGPVHSRGWTPCRKPAHHDGPCGPADEEP